MITWMIYAAAIGGLATAAGLVAERAVAAYGLPRRWIWAGAVLTSLGMPVAMAGRGGAPAPRVPAATPVGARAAAPTIAAAPVRPDGPGMAAAAWAIATAGLLLGLTASAGMLAVRRRRWMSATVAGQPVLLSARTGPAVAGVIRPRVVLPEWALDCPPDDQRLMVLHEMEHVRARDPLLLALAWTAAALMPWNAAMWYQLRALRLAVEIDCDARVLGRERDLRRYGDLLLRVGSLGSTAGLASAAMAEPRSFLERRIRAMTAVTPGNRGVAATTAVFALLLGGALVRAVPAPALPRIAPERVGLLALRGDTLPVWDIAQLDRRPELINAREVMEALQEAYPAPLRSAGIGGTVVLEMIVETDGSATPTRVVHSDRDDLAVAARHAAARIRFRPGQRDGRPARTRLAVPLSFAPETATRIGDGETAIVAAPADAGPAGRARRAQAAAAEHRAADLRRSEVAAARSADLRAASASAAAALSRAEHMRQAEVEAARAADVRAATAARASTLRSEEMRRAELAAARAADIRPAPAPQAAAARADAVQRAQADAARAADLQAAGQAEAGRRAALEAARVRAQAAAEADAARAAQPVPAPQRP